MIRVTKAASLKNVFLISMCFLTLMLVGGVKICLPVTNYRQSEVDFTLRQRWALASDAKLPGAHGVLIKFRLSLFLHVMN